MVTIPQTVVDKRTVVVKIFNTSAAYLTVKVSFGFYNFTVRAKVVKVDSFTNSFVN